MSIVNKILKEAEDNITNIILNTIPLFLKDYKTVQNINAGGCEDFAYTVKDKFPSCTILDDGFVWNSENPKNFILSNFDEKWDIDIMKKYGMPPFNLRKLKNFQLKGHVWIFYNGKHYDAETPNGVINFWYLPIFQRQLKKENLLKEAEITNHFNERIHQRFLDKPSFYVGYDLGRNQYQKLGRWSISDSDLQIIKDDIAFLQSLNFNPSKSYAIRLFKLKIDKSKVDYFDEEAKMDANGRALIVLDDEHTNGDVVYAVVGNNKLLSIYVVKSYQEHQFHTDIKTNIENIKSHISTKNKVLV